MRATRQGVGEVGRPDEHQRRVIESRARTIRVVAPAGSGKTRTIVARVLRRLAEGVPPERILLLTFDRSAAASLAARLERPGEPGARLPPVATLNAFGYRFLRRRVPVDHAPVATTAERLALAAAALDGLGRVSPARRRALSARFDPVGCAALFGLLKNAVLDPRVLDVERLVAFLASSPAAAGFLPVEGDRRAMGAAMEAIAWLYRDYDERMRRSRRMDFDDQKLRACLALRASQDLRREARAAYDEVVVDEFQDVNPLDFELVRDLSERAVLVVAGDDDQAIYGFRGCTPDYIVDLERCLGRDVASFELRHNYRNPPTLLRHAVRLIRHNRRRIPKRPIARREVPARVDVARYGDAEEEADRVAIWIRRAVLSETGASWRDFAVLVRLHAQTIPLRAAFARRGVPCVVHDPPEGLDGVAAGDESDRAAAESPSPPASDGVALLTYFKAKGSQWPTVVLVGCNERVIPHERAPVDDERRLFYVGLTRASARLRVSYLATDGARSPGPSRFLREAALPAG